MSVVLNLRRNATRDEPRFEKSKNSGLKIIPVLKTLGFRESPKKMGRDVLQRVDAENSRSRVLLLVD